MKRKKYAKYAPKTTKTTFLYYAPLVSMNKFVYQNYFCRKILFDEKQL
jgi:hypothetical protein